MELKMFINNFKIVSNYWRGTPQGPHSYILMIEGGGGATEVHILIPKKIPTSEFGYPKKTLLL